MQWVVTLNGHQKEKIKIVGVSETKETFLFNNV